MNEDRFEDLRDELGGAMDEDTGYSSRNRRTRHRSPFLDFFYQRRISILVGAGILLLVILIALFSGTDSEVSKDDLTAIGMRIDLLEKKLIRIEGIESAIPVLEKQETTLRQSLGETDASIKLLLQRIDEMNQRIEALENKPLPSAKKTLEHETEGVAKQAVKSDTERVHVVRSGENLYRISLKYGLTVDELCRLNNISSSQPLQTGQKLIIAPNNK
jgi:LysM repeat protein